MQPRCAIATSADYANLTPEESLLLDALRRRSIAPETVIWSDAGVDWASFDAILIRTTWDYTRRVAEFLDWIDRVSTQTLLLNDAAIIRWNAHKRYLLDLRNRGVTLPRTAIRRAGDPLDLDAFFAAERVEAAVVKPAVGAGGHFTYVISAADPPESRQPAIDLARERDVVIQQFVPEVRTVGEISIMLIDGEFAHAVRKLPSAAEFRVQERFGGSITPFDPPRELVETARRIAALTPAPSLYARVDMVQPPGGEPYLMELEVIEPSLYLSAGPHTAELLAAAVERRLRPR